MDLNSQRIFIRNIDRTDEIDNIRFLSDGKIGIIFKGSSFEYSYRKDNVSFQPIEDVDIPTESELEDEAKIDEEQKVLDEILNIIKKDCEEYEYSLRHSHNMGDHFVSDDLPSIRHALEPYTNLLDNPYFAKFKFDGDPCSYYVSEHNINRLPRELCLPKDIQIISVYSSLGKNIYNRSKTFYANSPIPKRKKLYDDYEVYAYNDSSRLDQSVSLRYDVIQKYRFNIRNNKIIGLSDETPR